MSIDQVFTPDAAFRAALRMRAPEAGAGRLVGLEHEYRLLRGEEQVDFRDLIHALPVPGKRLDPGDLNAYRLPGGLALTCDDAEAEIASPPVEAGPGFAAVLAGWAGDGHALLRRLLPDDIELQGFSTHLSVSVAEEHGDATARSFATRFAPAMMLLFDRPGGLGVYVRPRPGRLELCGDYLAGPLLRAAATFAAGAVRACAATVTGDADGTPLPAALAVDLRPATSRFGHYVGRRAAFGFDLYETAADAMLPQADGGTTIVQRYLQDALRAAAEWLGKDGEPQDLALLHELAIEQRPAGETRAATLPASAPQHEPTPYGRLLNLPLRDGMSATPVAATWDFTVFSVASGGGGRSFALVPRDALAGFVEGWAEGRLDDVLRAALSTVSDGRRLASRAQTREPGLWDEVEPAGLLPLERDPWGAQVASPKKRGPMRAGKGRAGKTTLPARRSRPALPLPALPPEWPRPPRPDPPIPAPPPVSPRPWQAFLAAGAVIAGLLLTAAAAAGGVGPFGGSDAAPPATASSSPAASATPLPASSSATRTPAATETQAPAETATALPAPAVASPTIRPATETPVAGPPPATPSPGIDPSATPVPTETPRPSATPSRTPEVTSTRTATPPAASPTSCVPGPGAICPTPTRTPQVLPNQ